MTQLELGSAVSKRRSPTKVETEALLAELLTKDHSLLEQFFGLSIKKANLQSLASALDNNVSLSQALLEKVGTQKLIKILHMFSR